MFSSQRVDVAAAKTVAGGHATDEERRRQERRRRQNRLNQRAHRHRQTARQGCDQPKRPFEVRRWRPDDEDPNEAASTAPKESIDFERQVVLTGKSATSWPIWPAEVEYHGLQLQSMIRLSSPQVDHHLHLIKFNVFRGMFYNKVLLSKLAAFKSYTDGVAKPLNMWNAQPTDTTVASLALGLPVCLQPTELQRTVPHPTWMDFLPFPEIRDALVLKQHEFNQQDMCNDVVGTLMGDVYFRGGFNRKAGNTPRLRLPSPGQPSDDASRKGIIVWGDPHLQLSWEFTEEFLKKWAWVFGRAEEVIKSANYWRLKRGERLLRVSDIVSDEAVVT